MYGVVTDCVVTVDYSAVETVVEGEVTSLEGTVCVFLDTDSAETYGHGPLCRWGGLTPVIV